MGNSSPGGPEMKSVFELLFQMSNPRKPNKVQTDAGKAFLYTSVQKFLKSHWIVHFVWHSDKKGGVFERFNSTMKTKIWTYFTAKQTIIYNDKFQDLENRIITQFIE